VNRSIVSGFLLSPSHGRSGPTPSARPNSGPCFTRDDETQHSRDETRWTTAVEPTAWV
jgi:hypothetical protein